MASNPSIFVDARVAQTEFLGQLPPHDLYGTVRILLQRKDPAVKYFSKFHMG